MSSQHKIFDVSCLQNFSKKNLEGGGVFLVIGCDLGINFKKSPSPHVSMASHDMKFVFVSFLIIISISQSKRSGRTTLRSGSKLAYIVMILRILIFWEKSPYDVDNPKYLATCFAHL